jgi:hypothetical protein
MSTITTAVERHRPVMTEAEQHIRRPRIDYESLAHLDRNKLGSVLVTAGLSSPRDHASVSLLALNRLRVSAAIDANIEPLGLERGHRTLTVLREGGKLVTMPLAPRVARAVDLAVGERVDGPIFLDTNRQRLDRHAARRVVRRRAAHAASRLHHRRPWTPASVTRRARSQSRRPAHDDALRPWPPIVAPPRHLHRRHVHRRRRPLTTNTPAFGAAQAHQPDVGTQPPTRPERPGETVLRRSVATSRAAHRSRTSSVPGTMSAETCTAVMDGGAGADHREAFV